MSAWDSTTAGLHGLLTQRGRLQKVINFRKAIGPNKTIRRCTMIRAIGLAEWEDLLLMNAGFSDSQLETTLKYIDQELDLRLERMFQPY